MSAEEWDAFEDIRLGQKGIFGSEQAALDAGLKKHEGVHSKVKPEGVVMELACQGCGKPTHLTVEWPEIVALKYGVNPAVAFRGHAGILKDPMRWEFRPDEQAWRPDCHCSQGCGFWIPLRVFPDEAERYLAIGRRSGFINLAGEAHISRIAATSAGGGQAVRR